MSDAPPAAGGECIHIVDENKNQIKITSLATPTEVGGPDSIITHAGKNIESYTKEGHIEHVVGPQSELGYTINVAGKGDINVTCSQGEITLTAEKAITLKCGSSKLILTRNELLIDAPLVNIKGQMGEVDIAGHTLTKHIHVGDGGPLPAPVSTPQK